MIATEVVCNLRELFALDDRIGETVKTSALVIIKPTGTGLRRTVFERLVNPEIIDALTERESALSWSHACTS